jgi:hypothetical protein
MDQGLCLFGICGMGAQLGEFCAEARMLGDVDIGGKVEGFHDDWKVRRAGGYGSSSDEG